MSQVFKQRVAALALLLMATVGVTANDQPYIEFGTDHAAGRAVWMENCEGCHGYGIAGAPVPMRTKEWSDRLKKPIEILYDNAINGFFGPKDTQMPAKGGNDSLTDEQVISAVQYMTKLANYYLTKGDKQ